MIRGLLFDFFGTLVEYSPSRRSQGFDTTHGILKARKIRLSYTSFLDQWVSAAEEMDRWSAEQHREYVMLDVAKRFLLRIHCDPAEETLANDLWHSYLNEWNKGVTYIQDIDAFIERLWASYKLGIVTNTHHAPLIWHHSKGIGIANAFQTVMTSVEHGIPKPHRAIFNYAIRSLGTTPSETLYVGDSYVADYLGAKAVGMPALLIDPRHESDVPANDRINHVFETENWLANACSQGR
jgi:putative hydrolase of the HAD superfamily